MAQAWEGTSRGERGAISGDDENLSPEFISLLRVRWERASGMLRDREDNINVRAIHTKDGTLTGYLRETAPLFQTRNEKLLLEFSQEAVYYFVKDCVAKWHAQKCRPYVFIQAV